MKKKSILNLIKYFSEKNDVAFKNEAYLIANDFENEGDSELAEYITALLSSANTFVPQVDESNFHFLEKVKLTNNSLPLPESILNDVRGMINAINNNIGVSKFLFTGEPGTGKTECAKQVARILERELYSVDFSQIIDSKLGQTQKNITELFYELNSFPYFEKVIFLFDELDALAMSRTDQNDVREMARTTSAFLKGFDSLNENVVVIGTTNLVKYFDKALLRRFDYIIDFNRYTIDDLVEISNSILNDYLKKFTSLSRNSRLFSKIIRMMDPVLMPGELKNAIKSCIAFSNSNDEYDYLRRLYFKLVKGSTIDIKELQNRGFTVRESQILSGVSKSKISRDLRGEDIE